MPDTIKIKRVADGGEQVERCEIFTFPTDNDRQSFITDLRELDPDVAYATNMDPDESEPERYLVAIPIRLYDFCDYKGE